MHNPNKLRHFYFVLSTALTIFIIAIYPVFQDLYEYLEAMVQKESAPEEAYRKFDELATKHIEVWKV